MEVVGGVAGSEVGLKYGRCFVPVHGRARGGGKPLCQFMGEPGEAESALVRPKQTYRL